MIKRQSAARDQRGVSLLEVLVTIVILAFGLLGLAGLQSKIQTSEIESFQRAQATLLLADMSERISANRPNAANYVLGNPVGTGDTTQPANCTTLGTIAARDICEWSHALRGTSEQITTASSVANTGAMQGGRGCIEQIQVPDPTPGVCIPGVYKITVVWQGMSQTTAPALLCGKGSSNYNPDSTRRAIATQVTVGLPGCV